MFTFYTNSVSPHQIPLAKKLVASLGEDNYRYIYTQPLTEDRRRIGWKEEREKWIVREFDNPQECRYLLENCDVLLSGIRDFDLFEKRVAKGKETLYYSERWFKPFYFGPMKISGRLRMLFPSYRAMAREMRTLLSHDAPFYYLAVGEYARMDMLEMVGEERRIIPWGYFLEADHEPMAERPEHFPLRILWCGRMLKLKNVETLLHAARLLLKRNFSFEVTLIGEGENETVLRNMAKGLPVTFLPFLPNSKVRAIMRESDLFVFPSCGREGWGAVVNEALLEGMRVIASNETGAGISILPTGCRFNPYDARELAEKIIAGVPYVGIGNWTTDAAAERLLSLCSDKIGGNYA